METLTDITVYVNPDGTFQSARTGWSITGKVDGYDAATTVAGELVAKSITDEIKSVIAQAIAQGPPPPPA